MDSMASDKLYLTVSREKRQPQDDGYIAVITQGSYQAGDDPVIVLDVEVVKNMGEAKGWFRRMKIRRPWEGSSIKHWTTHDGKIIKMH